MKRIFKQYLSYVFPIVEFKGAGEKHAELEVCWCNGRKILNTKNANYSFGSLHQIFKQAFHYFKLKLYPPDVVLILGFGAGSVYQILRDNYKFNGNVIGVEHDSKIIELAYRYFNVSNDSHYLKLVHKDAGNYLIHKTQQFDYIIVDLFGDLVVPREFLSENFIAHLIYHLKKGGKIFFNLIESDKKEREQLLKNLTKQRLSFSVFEKTIFGVKNSVIKIQH